MSGFFQLVSSVSVCRGENYWVGVVAWFHELKLIVLLSKSSGSVMVFETALSTS